jgi:hypothetical protein
MKKLTLLLIICFLVAGCAIGKGAKLRDYQLDVWMFGGDAQADTWPAASFYNPTTDDQIQQWLSPKPMVCYQCVIIDIDAHVPKKYEGSGHVSTPLIGK